MMVMIVNNSFRLSINRNQVTIRTMMCQPIAQNIDFSGSDQIQTPQYPDVHPPSPEIKREEPSQESDIHQLIEECSTKVNEKQKMEDTMLELVKICQEKEFLCIHDDVDDPIESTLNSKLLLINSNSQHLDKKEHEVKNVVKQPAERGNRIIQSLQNFKVVHKSSISFRDPSHISLIHAVATVLSTKGPEHLLSMGYEHLSITPKTESDKVTKSYAENLLPIPSKCKVTLEDEIECDKPIQDQSFSAFTTFSNPLFNNDDLDSSDDESFPDEDVPAEDFKIYSNPLFDEDEINFDNTDDVLPLSVENNDDSSSNSLLEEVDLFLSDNSIPPGIENIADDPEGDIRFLEELLIDDSILSHESSDSNFEDNPSIPRLPPEPPDAETDTGEFQSSHLLIEVSLGKSISFDLYCLAVIFSPLCSNYNLKEEFTVAIAETIPFLGELLEDVEPNVKSLAQEILRDMETATGEDLRQYL
nr:ARM repeat superfamily protein [Tanacetum cinerariifolium]